MEEDEYTKILELRSVDCVRIIDGVEELLLQTDAGAIVARYHDVPAGDAAVIWVGGAGGGLDGPARGLYSRLAGELMPRGVASLRLHYRRPNDLISCILDALLGVEYLKQRGRSRMALVGHSFGGAVVISAGAVSEDVVAVAALSSQTYGAEYVSQVSPRPLLLVHGTDDTVLPEACSHQLYREAREPKQIILYPGSSHGLDECREKLDGDLLDWLDDVLLMESR